VRLSHNVNNSHTYIVVNSNPIGNQFHASKIIFYIKCVITATKSPNFVIFTFIKIKMVLNTNLRTFLSNGQIMQS
jgi:hypothetical protein